MNAQYYAPKEVFLERRAVGRNATAWTLQERRMETVGFTATRCRGVQVDM